MISNNLFLTIILLISALVFFYTLITFTIQRVKTNKDLNWRVAYISHVIVQLIIISNLVNVSLIRLLNTPRSCKVLIISMVYFALMGSWFWGLKTYGKAPTCSPEEE